MGLEQFIDEDLSSSGSDNNEDDSNESQDQKQAEDNTGPYGYESYSEFEDTVEDHVSVNSDSIKYRLPVFPIITKDSEYSTAARYTLGDAEGIVSCLSTQQMTLGNVPREVIMLDTGEVEKDECMSELEDRFGSDVGPDTQVVVNTFHQVRHVVKMAMADSMTDDWSIKDTEHAMKAIHGESYTQRFRKSDDVDTELKGHTDIEHW
jgi:hypothetical protein